MLDVQSARDLSDANLSGIDLSGTDLSGTDGKVPQPKLEICELSKVFQVGGQREPLVVLDQISFSIWPREFVCLVGASGCGKSTLLSIAAGLTAPSAGQVRVDGVDVTGRPGSDRGMVFQGYTLYPWLTVLQNVAFGLQLRRLPKAEQRARASYFLDVVGLTQFANAYPKQLSGGMKQRVAIARALANEPEVLLMDEPFGALDAQTKDQMQQFLLGLWEKTHVSILMITHDVEEAIFLAQRVHVMGSRPGRIKQTIQTNLPEHHDLEIKLSPEFVNIKREIFHALREPQHEF
ncbi:MAG: ABC transporter ATP-binding protein [Pegethrix bostrychoides GSE-TBD4-15B]|jgi:NitT/TauT family transport system ATP-binding protein|uniref:ABC transporter ATP-binding protein n=1 Tax=Pegethrix bostrychoides GSE-TBD4-15B TaxID=2839662 RepID=A0A951P7R6_9CYAN|nr:ABC transporter ATP-binding protein [Pegethrix bostrychoides GSE-TBD4-15B]